jgi:hypothetical protein
MADFRDLESARARTANAMRNAQVAKEKWVGERYNIHDIGYKGTFFHPYQRLDTASRAYLDALQELERCFQQEQALAQDIARQVTEAKDRTERETRELREYMRSQTEKAQRFARLHPEEGVGYYTPRKYPEFRYLPERAYEEWNP